MGAEEILCYVEPVGEPNPSNLNEQKWAQPDDEIRATPWYIELERQAVSIQKTPAARPPRFSSH